MGGDEWVIEAPDGRRWHGASPLKAATAAQRDTIDPVLAMQRINEHQRKYMLESVAYIEEIMALLNSLRFKSFMQQDSTIDFIRQRLEMAIFGRQLEADEYLDYHD